MTSMGMAHGSEPTTASPIAWAVGGGDDSQSGTFRALAWSQDDDSVAEPLPYLGEDFEGFAAPAENTVERSAAPRYRRSTLLYGIAAGFVAVAVGGLVVTVLNTGSVPTSTSPVVVQPAEKAVSAVRPQQIQPNATAPAPRIAPAPAGPTAANTRPIAVTPAAAKAPAPQAPAPEAPAPQAAAPQAAAVAPEAAPAEPPAAAPPAAAPPVGTTPIVSVPQPNPQPVPHPVGPPVFHVPTTPEGGMPPVLPNPGSLPPIHVNVTPEGPLHPMVPNLGGPVTPVVSVPAAPAASNPGITLKPGVTVPPMIPNLAAN